jgi:surfactin synthase thioesterase subunit
MNHLSPQLIAAINAKLGGESIHELTNEELLMELKEIQKTSPEVFQENNPLDQLFKATLLNEENFA